MVLPNVIMYVIQYIYISIWKGKWMAVMELTNLGDLRPMMLQVLADQFVSSFPAVHIIACAVTMQPRTVPKNRLLH